MQTLFNRYSHGSAERQQKVRSHLMLFGVMLVSLTAVSGVGAASYLAGRPAQGTMSSDIAVTGAAKPTPLAAYSDGLGREDAEGAPSEQLQKLLEEWAAARPKQEWSVVVKGLRGDDTYAAVNSDKPHETASIYKLLLSYPLLQSVPLDELDSQKLSIEKEDKKKTEQTMAECLDLMLRISDNPCGEAVARFITYQKADRLLHDRGYLQTNLNRKEYMVTTAHDTALFLADLYEGRLLNPAERERVLSILKRQQVHYGIPSGCSGCTVMNKTGDWNGVRHDAGVVRYGGGAYVIAIFSKGGTYAEFADLTAQVHRTVSSR